ncbi:hypothetical protein ACHHV8_15005 [Paenibacillus sp. TAB 01]|uniref:hypothetical protein n=1 Tax=Paenibacillus sp. TAB 01 TaxID=3368988 RepID=UPI003750FBC5
MNSNLKSIVEIVFGIAFAVLFKWKVSTIYLISDRTSLQVTLFFAGIFVFYLSLHVSNYFINQYRRYGIFSYGGISGAAFVLFLILILLFVHTPKETIDYLIKVGLAWGIFIIAYAIVRKRF